MHLKKGLAREEDELQTAFLALIAQQELSGEVPPTPDDLTLFLDRVTALGYVMGNMNIPVARTNILTDWQEGYIDYLEIMGHLFKAGAEDVVFPGVDLALRELPDEADGLYTFHVIKLGVMHNLVTTGLRTLGANPYHVNSVYHPRVKEWPKFSAAFARTGYITHEAIWMHPLLRPEGEYKEFCVAF